MRKYKAVTGEEFIPHDTSGDQDFEPQEEPSQRQWTRFPESTRSQEAGTNSQLRVVCPCKKCERNSVPTPRFLRIANEHIRRNGMGSLYKVRFSKWSMIVGF